MSYLHYQNVYLKVNQLNIYTKKKFENKMHKKYIAYQTVKQDNLTCTYLNANATAKAMVQINFSAL
jgi:hypothetical protein